MVGIILIVKPHISLGTCREKTKGKLEIEQKNLFFRFKIKHT
jgi:hypothetical protein